MVILSSLKKNHSGKRKRREKRKRRKKRKRRWLTYTTHKKKM